MGFPIGRTLTVHLYTPSLVATPGQLRTPDSGTPTVGLRRDGSSSGLTILPSIAAVATGEYKISHTFDPSEWDSFQCYNLHYSYTMEGIIIKASAAQGYVESLPFLESSVASSPTISGFTGSSGLSSLDDVYNNALMVFTEGVLAGLTYKITDYIGSSRTFSVSNNPFPVAPGIGDKFLIVGRA